MGGDPTDDGLSTLDELPVGIAVFDAQLRYLYANDAFAELDGSSPARLIGRTAVEVRGGPEGPLEVELRRVLESGEPLAGQHLRLSLPARPEEEHWWSVCISPLRKDAGSSPVSPFSSST